MSMTDITTVKEPLHIGAKVHRTFTVVRDKTVLATLNKDMVQKADEAPKNGFWAIASIELPEGDSDGDCICIDGITSDLDAANDRYLPLLPGHKMSLSDGKAAEIGRIEKLVKTVIGGVKALAMYFTFALDDAGQPMDDLVASYYKRYVANYSNTFSVGMSATEEPMPNDMGGYTFPACHLYEVSCVSIPANAGAIGLTRSKEDDAFLVDVLKQLGELKLALKAIEEKLVGVNAVIDSSFVKAFEPLEQRLDTLESQIVVAKAPKPEPKPVVKAPKVLDQLNELLDKKLK